VYKKKQEHFTQAIHKRRQINHDKKKFQESMK